MKNRHPKFMQKGNGGQQQQPVSRKIDQATAIKYMEQPKVKCANCNKSLFVQCIQIHKISMIISSSGQQEYFTVPRSACLSCHELLPLQP